tara:strand:+ start:264 stop:1025 length:762 start_codon:yes stop_codon:yes gene_type:complete
MKGENERRFIDSRPRQSLGGYVRVVVQKLQKSLCTNLLYFDYVKTFLLIFLLFLTPHTLFGSVNRVNTNVLSILSNIMYNQISYNIEDERQISYNIEYERQISQYWFLTGRLAYRFYNDGYSFVRYSLQREFDFSFTSSTIMLKRYFDTDLLGSYVAVGYQYRFFTLYSYSYNFSLEKQIKTVYTGGKLNEDTFLVEIGYSDIIMETLYITAYSGISKYLVVGSEIITDESGTRARMKTILFSYLGISLGYEF